MIGSLRGVLLDRSPAAGEVTVEVGGVGYRVVVAPPTMAALGDIGDAVFVHVHTHVREDALVLYGFATADERRCFEALLGAHGVGPAMALGILAVHAPPALRRIVACDDADALTLVPGIGKKTAARLLLELKSRLELPDGDAGVDVDRLLARAGVGGDPAAAEHADVRAALAHLGYGPEEIRDALHALSDAGADGADGATASVEELLRLALRSLAAAR
jgi:Holliday junction DNA helicase RuvA